MSVNKKAYFQGGGGVNEPTPGKKKYKSDPALVVQPRFKEPFYRNYDLYTIPGMEEVGPGTGWHGLQNYKSVQDFLKDRRKRLQPRYVADDSWQIDSGERVKKNPDKKARMTILERIIKQAEACQDSDIEYSDGRDAWICGKCLHMGPNAGGPTPSAKELHAGKNHNSDKIDWRNGHYENDPKYLALKEERRNRDENDGPNFDYGHGAYDAMNKGEKMKTITDFKRTSPGALMGVKADHMMAPKEHGTSIYDWRNSPYQGKPKAPKSPKRRDCNDIDFPIDEEVNHQGEMVYPGEENYQAPKHLVGPAGPPGDTDTYPSDVGPTDQSSYINSAQIAGEHSYLPKSDEESRSDEALDFGRDYTDETLPGRPSAGDDKAFNLDELESKYLESSETGLFGLPDGVDPEGHDADQTEQIEQPFAGTSDIGTQMYEDKWNI